MEQNRALAVVGIIVVLVLAIILGTLFYLNKTFQKNTPKKVATTTPAPTLTTFPLSTPAPTSSNISSGTSNQGSTTITPPITSGSSSSVTVSGDSKIYNGSGFQLKYPKNWGLLTCNNSQNFELDPTSSNDSPNYACDLAVKPITILVGNNDCSGVSETINGINVVKSVKTYANGGIDYDWCTQTTPALHMSNRVDPTGARATSKTDYSYQVEQIISSLSFSGGS